MEHRLYYQISKTQNKFRQFIKRSAEKRGIQASPAQLGILFLLKENKNLSMSNISNELDLDNSAITRSIDKLEKLGFARRAVNCNDRREYTIEITKEGLAETEKAGAMIKEMNERLEKIMTNKKLESLKELLVELEKVLNFEI